MNINYLTMSAFQICLFFKINFTNFFGKGIFFIFGFNYSCIYKLSLNKLKKNYHLLRLFSKLVLKRANYFCSLFS